MKHLGRKWFAAAACLGVMVSSAFSGQATDPVAGIKRIYVEAFPVKTGSQKLREELIAKLRKSDSISIVASESDADAILTGNGETWIKGYRSLNPRSGRLPSDGEPVYAGFLSVELTDPQGNPLWSYLVNAGPASEAIFKDLAKQIAKHLTEARK